MKWRIGLLLVSTLCAANQAWAQDTRRPSSDRARAGVGLGLQIHIPFGQLNQHRPQRTATIAANGGWTSCGLIVTPGMHVAIDVRDGRWASGRRAAPASTRGDSADADGYVDSAGREPNAPLARANLGALIARVGDGPVFFVGSHYLGDPPGTGDLQLAINDDLDHRRDNRGVLTVTCVASHDTPAFVPPPPREPLPPPQQEAPPEPVATTTKPPPPPAPEPVAIAPVQAPILAPPPETTVATTAPVEPPPPEPKPATPWGWIIAAIIAGASIIALLVRAAGAGAAAAGAITTRVIDNGVTTQQLTIKSGRKK